MPWTLNKLSYVQVDSFPQNEIARNRINGEKSEFDSNSATNTFGIGLQVNPYQRKSMGMIWKNMGHI